MDFGESASMTLPAAFACAPSFRASTVACWLPTRTPALCPAGAEIAIDSGCATFAEVRKRGKEFWDEFEFYLSDLLVGLVMDVVLVGLLAPVAILGKAKRKPTGGAHSLSCQTYMFAHR